MGFQASVGPVAVQSQYATYGATLGPCPARRPPVARRPPTSYPGFGPHPCRGDRDAHPVRGARAVRFLLPIVISGLGNDHFSLPTSLAQRISARISRMVLDRPRLERPPEIENIKSDALREASPKEGPHLLARGSSEISRAARSRPGRDG